MWYKLTFKQLQPINLGYKKHGVINETRIFITGQSMWGALSNAYAKTEQYNQTLFEKITCFYPMIDNKILYPKYQDGEFYLGDISEREFRYKFTTTYLSTAINPLSRNAKDESLHEIDVILPKDKDENNKNKKELFWVGYLEIGDKDEIPKEIYIGSDSKYGLGLMRLEDEPIEDNFNYEVIKGKYQNNSYPRNEPLSNFLKFEQNIEFEGELELLAEFDFSKNRPKVKEDSGAFYIRVGSKIRL